MGGGGGGEAGVLTHYKSEQEEEEGVYGGDPGTQLFFMGFLIERRVMGPRLRQYSVGPVWLSAASRSVLIHTVSIILLTPRDKTQRVNNFISGRPLNRNNAFSILKHNLPLLLKQCSDQRDKT